MNQTLAYGFTKDSLRKSSLGYGFTKELLRKSSLGYGFTNYYWSRARPEAGPEPSRAVRRPSRHILNISIFIGFAPSWGKPRGHLTAERCLNIGNIHHLIRNFGSLGDSQQATAKSVTTLADKILRAVWYYKYFIGILQAFAIIPLESGQLFHYYFY